jgi:hypothetical protein
MVAISVVRHGVNPSSPLGARISLSKRYIKPKSS